LKGISSSRRCSFLTHLEVLVSIHIIADQEYLFQAGFRSNDREIEISFAISSIEMKFSLLKDMSESVELNDPAEVDSTAHIAPVPPTDQDDPRWQTSSIVRRRDPSTPIPSTMDAAFTNEDWDEVHRVFPDATMILYSYPFCVICGVTPPDEPVSVKGLITEFYDNIEEYSYLPCDFGNPLVPDPLEKPFERSKHFPNFDELDARRDELERKVGIPLRTMSLYLHAVVIEVDEEFLDLDKLPGKVGGRIACWGAYGQVWKWELHAHERNDPQIVGGDDSDYKPGMGPGIKICGEIGSASAGVLMKNTRNGEQVITVPAHIVDSHNEVVLHPDCNPSNRIGKTEQT